MATKPKIILIGPVTNIPAGLIGGATISFGYLVDFLKSQNENFVLINTQRFPKGILRFLNPIHLFVKVLLHALSSDVVFLNSSRGGTKYVAPVLFFVAKAFRLKFVYRPFGGDIKDYTSDYGKLSKWIFRNTVLKADILFLQTRELMNFYAGLGTNTVQLPTSRAQAPTALSTKKKYFEKRFVYLGFVNTAKGIDQLLAAKKELGDEYTIHIYGPIKEAKYHEVFKHSPDIYQGVLSKEKVLETICKYNVMVLPTYYEGEGYPGAIIESYSLGIPVVTTKWKAIPEIVQHEKTGLLIAPKSTEELVEAIRHFTPSNYFALSDNAKKCFDENFDTEVVTSIAIRKIKELLKS
ncbi:MAG: glycosyltransferase family 4 protein [Saprospiraceae bacterium]